MSVRTGPIALIDPKQLPTVSEADETAICHVCGERSSTQEELLKHREQAHPDDVLPGSDER
jgi:hypothetical protein